MAGYGTNAGFIAYAEAAGYVIPDGTTDEQKAAARQRGSLVIDRYEPKFSGRRKAGYAQERVWPRTGATTRWGEAIGENDVPVVVVNACYEAAFLELTNPGSLSPVVVGAEVVKREKVGPLETEYAALTSASPTDAAAMATPVVTIIDGMLWPFFTPAMPGILVV
ncbi:hypothetical protein P9A16_34455 [Shinella sp. 838]|uniref:DnaT-like ssDNA-binding protein n=1 Tax=Shinella sp. 838 TaxID=3038164 RepID=UPI002415132A|nr:DnaT-like ssDNA-binding protein [Shinella sp. 838]MDG4676188.1 hypothetical protein [Shinella sp. 838]